MEILNIKINELKPYENNAKVHSPEQIKQIKDSIMRFGMNDPIGVWGKDNVIVEGHGRYIALKELGYDEVPCIRLDNLTDEQRKEYTLIHNKLTMNTDFDVDALNVELFDIMQNDRTIDMENYGFSMVEVVSEDDFGTDFELPEGDKKDTTQMTITVSERQKELIESSIDLLNGDYGETYGNTNKTGNGIAEICRRWAAQKK